MALDPRARRKTKQSRRADGVTIASAPGARKPFVWLVAAAALVLLAALVWSGPPRTARVADPAEPPAVAARADAPAPAPPARAAKPALHPVRATQPLVLDRPGPAPPQAASAPQHLPNDAGGPPVPSGIGLFPPPGTDPPKRGIVVPDDFELPEGYVRHYQVTDDGKELPAILMFHPDYDWVDELGNHHEVSESGVVPAELAPEGMPIEMLELPAPESDGGAPAP